MSSILRALVATDFGFIPIEYITPRNNVLTRTGFSKVKNVFKTVVQKVLRIQTDDGDLFCTPDLLLAVRSDEDVDIQGSTDEGFSNGNYIEWIEAKNLQRYHKLLRAPINTSSTIINIDLLLEISTNTSLEVEGNNEYYRNGFLSKHK